MKPTMRFKQRYVLFGISGSESNLLSEKEVRDFIFSFLLSFFGEEGFARFAFKLISYDNARKKGIMRCERGRLGEMIAAFALSERIGGKNARVECLQTSGTIKGLKQDKRGIEKKTITKEEAKKLLEELHEKGRLYMSDEIKRWVCK